MLLAAQFGSPAAADPTTAQLSAIAAYLEANDVEGLRTYLAQYPDLAEGTTPLAVLLRRFLVESASGNSYYRFRPNVSDGPQAAPSGPGY